MKGFSYEPRSIYLTSWSRRLPLFTTARIAAPFRKASRMFLRAVLEFERHRHSHVPVSSTAIPHFILSPSVIVVSLTK